MSEAFLLLFARIRAPQHPTACNSDSVAHPAISPVDPGDLIAGEEWLQNILCIICGRSYTTYQERMTPTGCTAPENEFHRKILDLPTDAGSLVRTQAADQYL